MNIGNSGSAPLRCSPLEREVLRADVGLSRWSVIERPDAADGASERTRHVAEFPPGKYVIYMPSPPFVFQLKSRVGTS